jgi:hypothetical protein
VTHPHDWSYDVYAADDIDPDIPPFHEYDKIVGELAVHSLDYLSRDITGLEADGHGWTEIDYGALRNIYEADWLERLLVPPATTPLENRITFNERMASLRQALPFSETERQWLFDDPDSKRRKTDAFYGINPQYVEAVRRSEVQFVSAGLYRVVHGRDLMQRWWSWRRETGEYADGAGLNQARESLKGLIELIAPELGLPESYTALRPPSSPEA